MQERLSGFAQAQIRGYILVQFVFSDIINMAESKLY